MGPKDKDHCPLPATACRHFSLMDCHGFGNKNVRPVSTPLAPNVKFSKVTKAGLQTRHCQHFPLSLAVSSTSQPPPGRTFPLQHRHNLVTWEFRPQSCCNTHIMCVASWQAHHGWNLSFVIDMGGTQPTHWKPTVTPTLLDARILTTV
jgi:hypothetical protein